MTEQDLDKICPLTSMSSRMTRDLRVALSGALRDYGTDPGSIEKRITRRFGPYAWRNWPYYFPLWTRGDDPTTSALVLIEHRLEE